MAKNIDCSYLHSLNFAKAPILETAVEALENTINETNQEMFKSHSEIQSEINIVVETELKTFQKTDFKLAGYDRHGGNLPLLEFRSEADENF